MEYKRKMNPIIKTDNISKEFASSDGIMNVLQDINLSVNENEFVVLFGPGQCGKTTLLNIIAGLERSTSGKAVVNGEEILKPGPERGVIYQNVLLFPWLTVMGNVEFGPKARGVNKKERQEKALYYINLVGLKGFEKEFPVKLSGGMKQRVGIARAYCNDPKVMLMDEPFGALDAQTRYLMQDELIRISETEKKTVVFVTNNIEEAVYLADRIIVLTNCPSTVKSEYVINLPRPRNYVEPEFLKIRKEISSVMDKTN
jgi:NitT/TauT family transport system ATP-binding protein/sulfonate transport system ATP-binding protein